jgi:murein L,D-transpeptidase YcbB/YkuD
LETAVKDYKKRMGMKEDGVISQSLINNMNIPIEKRIEQIIVNMERCRWVPVETGGNFILINIPDFKLHLFENDSLLWSMKIVVGKNQNQTAIFSGTLTYIVFSPYWNVPQSIMKKEILPAMNKNSNYLNNHNMEWYSGGIRQKPGPDNALGLVKFLFPNSHSIYMHDTPSKSLFNEDKRAFSHGCIRIAEPKKLAIYLLKDDKEWDENSITAAMNSGTEKFVTLKKKLPVIITYFTSWVDHNGKINFRSDIYQKDQRLAKMILDKPVL